jgi:hypothetical protein
MTGDATSECLEFAATACSKVRHPERIALTGRVIEKELE